MISLMQGDCLELMQKIPDGGADMVLCDLPYGTTACKWDSSIPFGPIWQQYSRIVKPSGAICLFGQEPFSTSIRASNLRQYRYDWIWEKPKGSGFFNAKKCPLRNHEIISVFYKKHPTYNPQMRAGKPYKARQGYVGEYLAGHNGDRHKKSIVTTNDGYRYPVSILRFDLETGYHPTQKPVPLLEYLIKTYTNAAETVLDNCMGSGSTGVACVNTGRDFIGIELDQGYFETAQKRISEAQAQMRIAQGGGESDGQAK